MVTINKTFNGEVSYEFKGLSSDTKPETIGGKDVGDNSLFLELDTGKFYYFDGEGKQWVEVGQSPA